MCFDQAKVDLAGQSTSMQDWDAGNYRFFCEIKGSGETRNSGETRDSREIKVCMDVPGNSLAVTNESFLLLS